jgi:cytochrome c-type biogenesis protein CcmH/NrfF
MSAARPRTASAAAALVVALALAALLPSVAAAVPARASFTDIENDVMCVSCRTPLAVAGSPQAYAERAYIKGLIAQGETKAQIERALVAQYGPAVLGLPPAHGFNLTVYIIPPAIVLAGLAILAFTLPKWRARSRAAAARPAPAGPPIDPKDARRLEEDLARFDG